MKQLIPVLALMCLASTAMADQKATITCTGQNVRLTEKSPYLGENSKFTQSLFVLNDGSGDESRDTAYFLDVDVDGDVDKWGDIYTYGENKQGGTFTLKRGEWEPDTSTPELIHEITKAFLTYNHGTLKGKDVPVICIRE